MPYNSFCCHHLQIKRLAEAKGQEKGLISCVVRVLNSLPAVSCQRPNEMSIDWCFYISTFVLVNKKTMHAIDNLYQEAMK